MEKIAIIQVKGTIRSDKEILDTLQSLNLHSQNYCTIVSKSAQTQGMIQKAKDYITWGEIDEATYKELLEKRGEEYKGRTSDSSGTITYSKHALDGKKKIKKFFRLSPPIKGYGRKGVKHLFSNGGALGYRGAKINDLIKRML